MSLFSRLHIYTVHLNPKKSDALHDIRFVAEGFNLWAFVFTALWALYQRCWGFAVAIALANVALIYMAEQLAMAEQTLLVLQLLLQMLIGYEANDALRRRLSRAGFITTALVSGENTIRAEQRYFDQHHTQFSPAAL